jgi:hypothetical protein
MVLLGKKTNSLSGDFVMRLWFNTEDGPSDPEECRETNLPVLPAFHSNNFRVRGRYASSASRVSGGTPRGS